MRSPHGSFPEYHTSADNLDFVQPRFLAETLRQYLDIVEVLEHNRVYVNLNPKCEPQLGKRGLYQEIGGDNEAAKKQLAMLWVLNLSDGKHSLLDIAVKSASQFGIIRSVAEVLVRHGLLREFVEA